MGLVHLGITLFLAKSFIGYRIGTLENKESISIIIAARNEESNLKVLIPSLLSQDHSNFEIIVALDRCTDLSKSYLDGLESSKITSIEIENVEIGWNPKKFALKEAISKAKGDWLVYTDADCVPYSDQWLNKISTQMSNETDIIIGVSPYRTDSNFLSHFIQFEAFATAFMYVARALQKKTYMAVGRNMTVRKSFFLNSEGYESIKSIQGGDDDLFIQKSVNRDNTKVILGKESLVYTSPKKTWRAYWNQKIRHLSVGSKYKGSDQFFLGLNHFSHFAFTLLLFFVTTQSFFLPVLLFYLFIKLGSYRFAASKMETNINYILLPLVDILYAMLIPVIALWSKLEMDIKWKN